MDNKHLSALLTLLRDENPEVASLTMEHFLTLGKAVDRTIAEYQESHDPRLRRRMHQLSNIISRRQARERFIEALNLGKLSLWEGVVQIHSLYEPVPPRRELEHRVDELAASLGTGDTVTHQIADLMREAEFTVPAEEILDVDLFLVHRVLDTRYGHAALLCVLAKRLAARTDWKATVCLHQGRFCLIDKHHVLLDPSAGWRFSKQGEKDPIHPCSRKDVLLAILAQLFMVALVDGQLKDLHHFGTLLTGIGGHNLDALPYPLGSTS